MVYEFFDTEWQGLFVYFGDEFLVFMFHFFNFLLYSSAFKANQSPFLGEGPLQYSCLENPMEGGALWAAVHGVAKSWT